MIRQGRTFRPFIEITVAAFTLMLLAGAATADARTYGSTPLNISVTPGGAASNGDSSDPVVSGDDRHSRYVAFSSLASNLVRSDSNGASDVFVWRRPGGIPRRIGSGSLRRVSIGRFGQANAASTSPSIDGSLRGTPRCVAFASAATNLSPSDALPDIDIFVRDFHRGKTFLVSRGVAGDATNPTVSGNCRKIAFESAGLVRWARPSGGKVHTIAKGSQPSYSRDSRSLVYVRPDGKVIFMNGSRKRKLRAGSRPLVSDRSPIGGWAVAYNSGRNVKMTKISGGRTATRVVARRAILGGVTSYAAHRGIIVWARSGALNYLNLNSGNSDDLAYARTPINEISISARANLIAYAASRALGTIAPKRANHKNVYVKALKR